MRYFLIPFVFGMSILSVFAQPSNDDYANAVDVSGLLGSCSSDALYTTVSATGDLNVGACWSTGSPLRNVWFKFTATTSEVNITVDVGGVKGTQRRTQVALWQSDGTTPVSCNTYVSDTDDVVVGATTLSPGDVYYFSVDVQNTAFQGTFSLCLSDAVDYDYYEGAVDVTGLINSCSADAAYTTIGATGDQNAGSCWNTGAQYNRWFKFTAPASGTITATVDRGGSKGTIRRVQLAIWDTDGTTELSCNQYVGDNDVVNASALGLTPGNTYYISVDNNYSGYRGTFTLCLSDAADYDYYEGALDVTGLINSCSTDEAYTTIGATGDKNAGSCWNTAAQYNRWFKFTAPASGRLTVTVDRGGSKGTIRRVQLAIWDVDGTTELSCNQYVGDNDVVNTTALGLTPGNTYYISVDNNYSGYRGTFTLCLSDAADYDYYEGALDVTGLINSCSADALYTTIGATGDKNAGSCWNTAAQYNRWFKFTAPASGRITVTVDRGGSKGTIRRVQLAIWDVDGTTELSCNQYVGDNDVVNTTALGLTPGNTYYISVDNNYSGYRGTFTLCLSDAADYDYYEGALDVTGLINSCSADAAYTTIGATGDKNAGSCWNTAAQYNRWFKFTAPASGRLTVTVDRGGSKGTIRRVQLAIWDVDGTTELSCNQYVGDNDVVNTTALGLTPGNTYYISVDNNYSGYRGTFTLCLSDAADYDYYEGALDVTGLINSCSADAAYTTIGATGDKNAGSCWNTAAQYNRWFKFTAPASGRITVTVDRGGSKGTIRRVQLAIWDADGTTELSCNQYVGDNDVVNTTALGLTPGNTYYVSVDNNYSGYRGTFTLCLSDAADYDYYEGALLISDINNWCSADAAYTTIGATGDMNAASCWNTSPNYNRWFKFVATGPLANVTVKRGGALGTIRRINVALWEDDGTTQVACNRYVGDNDDVSISAVALTPGNTYYISVDNNYSGYRGTFTLCVTDEADYDFYEGAIELTDLNNWCSADAAYTTVGATRDKNAASCWNTSPNYNRWFKFTAITPDATIDVKRGGSFGTIRRINLALFQSDGTTQVACSRYAADNDNVSIVVSGLTVGNTYYIAVDNNYDGYRGTFTLCVDNVNQVYYSRTSGAWNDGNNWSLASHAGPAAGTYPTIGDVALIEGHSITITTNENIAEVDLNVASANTELIVNGATLSVAGKVTLTNTGNNFSGGITVTGNGNMSINDNLELSRSGGNSAFGVTVNTGSLLTINRDLNWSSTGGTTVDNTFIVNGTGALVVNQDVNLTSTGGRLMQLQGNNNASITVARDIVFNATAAGQEQIQLNNSARLRIGRNFVRGGTPYGTLISNGTSTVEYFTNTYLQTLAASGGAGGDAITYNNLTINNTRITTPQVTLGGAVTVNGNLTLTSGVVSTTAVNILNLKNASATTIGNTSSYIDGPMTYEVATSTPNTIRNLPLGNNGHHRPAILRVTHSDATPVVYTARHYMQSAAALGYTLPGTLEKVSGVRYWTVDRTAVANLTSADITLYYGIGTSDGVTDPANLRVAKTNGAGTAWFDAGGTGSAAGTGTITSDPFTSFSTFTLANAVGGTNPLPIELKKFDAFYDGQEVQLEWTTASELNNDFFTVQRSSDGLEFESLFTLPGKGTTTEEHKYLATDAQPIDGISYYRLKQTDFDGASTFSGIVKVEAAFTGQVTFEVYPNPTDGENTFVKLNGVSAGTNIQVTVHDLVGRNVLTVINSPAEAETRIIPLAIEDLPQGIYMVTISGGNRSISKRLMVR